MNGTRDIDRVLDAWFVDGPSVMPDRLFDAVLDRVERVPQRRLARLSMRYAEMNPRIRLFTVLAAALVAVLAAVALIGGGSSGPVKATDAPSPTPSATPPAVRNGGLAGMWMGGPTGLAGLDPDGGTVLVFEAPDKFRLAEAAQDDLLRVRSTVALLAPGLMSLTSLAADPDCRAGDVGQYTWTLSSGGEAMTIEMAAADQCPSRGAIAGTWERMDCPTKDDNCLGDLDAGAHSSHFFDPFVAHGGAWTPRFGAVEYTVPARWLNFEDWPEFYQLRPAGASDGTEIIFTSEVRAIGADQCSGAFDPSVGRTATELADWLYALDGVAAAAAPKAVTIGGLAGWTLDVTVDPAWTEECPFFPGVPSRGLWVDSDPGEGFHWGIPYGSTTRVWLLDLGDGRALLIDFESPTQAEFDQHVAAATTIVEGLTFRR